MPACKREIKPKITLLLRSRPANKSLTFTKCEEGNEVSLGSRHGSVEKTKDLNAWQWHASFIWLLVKWPHSPAVSARVDQPHEMQSKCVAEDVGIEGGKRILAEIVVDRDGNDKGQDERRRCVDPESDRVRVYRLRWKCLTFSGSSKTSRPTSRSCRSSFHAWWRRDASCSTASPCDRRRNRALSYADRHPCRWTCGGHDDRAPIGARAPDQTLFGGKAVRI